MQCTCSLDTRYLTDQRGEDTNGNEAKMLPLIHTTTRLAGDHWASTATSAQTLVKVFTMSLFTIGCTLQRTLSFSQARSMGVIDGPQLTSHDLVSILDLFFGRHQLCPSALP